MDRIARSSTRAQRASSWSAGSWAWNWPSLRHRGLAVTLWKWTVNCCRRWTRNELAAGRGCGWRGSSSNWARRCRRSRRARRHDGDRQDGRSWTASVVALCVGVKPNSALARAAGLETGSRGMSSSTRRCGRLIGHFRRGRRREVVDPVFGGTTAVPLAGPANRQAHRGGQRPRARPALRGTFGAAGGEGRQADGRELRPHGSQAEIDGQEIPRSTCMPDRTRATIPARRRAYQTAFRQRRENLRWAGHRGRGRGQAPTCWRRPCARAWTCASSRAGLCYAPPFSSVRNPITVAGMIATNALDGVRPWRTPRAARRRPAADVREPAGHQGTLKGVVNVPLHKCARVRAQDRQIVVFCQSACAATSPTHPETTGLKRGQPVGRLPDLEAVQPSGFHPTSNFVATTGSEADPAKKKKKRGQFRKMVIFLNGRGSVSMSASRAVPNSPLGLTFRVKGLRRGGRACFEDQGAAYLLHALRASWTSRQAAMASRICSYCSFSATKRFCRSLRVH